MGLGDSYRLERLITALYGTAGVPLLIYGPPGLFAFFLTSGFLLLALLFLFRFKTLEHLHFQLGWLLFGLFYLPLLLGHLVPLRLLDHGQHWIFLTLIVIMSCDSCAYFVGRRFGRRNSMKRSARTRVSRGLSVDWQGLFLLFTWLNSALCRLSVVSTVY